MRLIVSLIINKNVVYIDKSQDTDQVNNFVSSFLIKYEDVTKVDPINSTRTKKRFKVVKEIRYLYTENDDYIMFSRGILELIPESEYIILSSGEGDKIKVPDLSLEEIRKTLDVFDLRDDQVIAVNKGLRIKRGVIQLPTATGKSAIITSINKRLIEENPDMHSLVIAPTLSTAKNIGDTLSKNGLDTSIYGHPSKEIDSTITVALPQSLVTSGDDDLLKNIDAVFYDECLPYNSKVLLPDGSSMSIGDIYNNDVSEVWSYNIETDTYESKRIIHKYKTPFNDRFCKVYYYDNVKGKLLGVTCTPNHKIYTKNRGYVKAEDLTTDDYIKVDYQFARNWKVLCSYTYVKVSRVTFNVGKVAEYKYNIEVEGNHNYFANNVLVSNCHHLKCDTWNRLNSMLSNVEYSLGFSALSIDKKEIYKTDFRDLSYDSSLIVGSSGRVIMHMDPSYYIERGIIALPIVMRISHNELLPENFDESQWSKLVKVGLMSTARTSKVAKSASIFANNGRKVLILVSERNYAFKLCEFLVKNDITRFGISFGAGVGYTFKGFGPPTDDDSLNIEYNSEKSLDVVNKLDTGDIDVLIATTHLDEGVDINGLDVCILACGGKKDRRIIQRVGRVLRKSKNGKYAYIIDFTDSQSRVLSRQSRSRLSMYKKDIGVPSNNIYDNIDINDIDSKFKELEGLI